ncbi:MAG: riboflavin synthase [Acidobacteria bacterium]|nr:riboflavin synthase [Acidobacteriota bacterium]MBV9481669.1 riboflavin synthase [Acidobacteriota bacterium]
MFTGIIEEVGRIARIDQQDEKRRITIRSRKTSQELRTGNSVSVSGVCLTALDIKPGSFCADLAPESWARTSFSRIQQGALVNLELAMKCEGRWGGHIVQGHVDGVGKVAAFDRVTGSGNWWLKVDIPSELNRYVVHKGSIAIEGISLTVASIEDCRLTIAIIPHTVEMTNLKVLQPGDPVNIEADVIAKYVEKMMKGPPGESTIRLETLVQQGF